MEEAGRGPQLNSRGRALQISISSEEFHWKRLAWLWPSIVLLTTSFAVCGEAAAPPGQGSLSEGQWK